MARTVTVQALLDAIEEPALIVEGGRTAAANRAAKALLGDNIVGSDIRLAFRQPAALAAIQRGVADDAHLDIIGGVSAPWTLSIRPTGNGGGSMLVRLVDRSQAIAAERMRVDFVANASHELRTPLATIIGYAETLEDGDIDPAIRSKFAHTIGAEAKRMQGIIEDLMSLSRIEADRFVLPRATVDLGAIAERAIEQIAPLAERRQCKLSLEREGGVPPVRGDDAQLVQVLDNLISNAIRYGSSRTNDEVKVRVASVNGRPGVQVVDHGEGIAAHHLPRLTERFYRVDGARSRDSGGTGLGLAIVKHIVERHRGSLDISSAPGIGTTVTISFPLALSSN